MVLKGVEGLGKKKKGIFSFAHTHTLARVERTAAPAFSFAPPFLTLINRVSRLEQKPSTAFMLHSSSLKCMLPVEQQSKSSNSITTSDHFFFRFPHLLLLLAFSPRPVLTYIEEEQSLLSVSATMSALDGTSPAVRARA
jgi:hypothetical protein